MNNVEFVARAKEVALGYNTVYAKGMIGHPITEATVASKRRQYPEWYTDEICESLLADQNRFGFDCVCLVKSILWGWSGDREEVYGGAVYCSNGVPDIGTEQMIAVCTDVSTDFSTIVPGELLWMKGHVGIYIGDGLAVECTTAWSGDVQITAVHNIGTSERFNGRTWVKHGKLPYITYAEPAEKETGIPLSDLARGAKGAEVVTLQALLVARGYFSVDGSFGAITEAAVRAFQSDSGLDVTGKVDKETWETLLKGEWSE